MAVKKYTAQEMRDRANEFDEYLNSTSHFAIEEIDEDARVLSAMLHQAADALEREKREKRYEYAVEYEDLYHGGWSVYKNGLTLDEAQKWATESWSRIVRREVCEWEEVKNGQES